MAEITWTQEALEDMKNIAAFISKDSEKYAQIEIDRLYKATQILKTFPKTGRVVAETSKINIREIIQGNYRIIYQTEIKERISILTVHHSHRNLSNNPLFSEL